MRRANSKSFSQKERDALIVATASDAEILDLCRQLGDNPRDLANRVRKLLLSPVRGAPSTAKPTESSDLALPLSDPGMLPLHRILLVDDDPASLARRLEEFRLHQFKLGFVIETTTNGRDAIARLEKERFEAVLIELRSPAVEDRQLLQRLRSWSTPLAPILLNSEGMEVLELRKLDRELIRALASGLGKEAPRPYRKRAAGLLGSKPVQSDLNDLFDASDPKKTGTT
jgi:CheY-like chemotaxis protein